MFDASAPVSLEEMTGVWRGSGMPTGHPLDGLLERYGWYGKRFRDANHVDPLLFGSTGANARAVSPRLMPLGLIRFRALAHAPFTPPLFKLVLPLMRTSRAAARLRMIEYRGVTTATMIYDDLPIHDVFRRLDAERVIGLMDKRGEEERPFFFVLSKDTPP